MDDMSRLQQWFSEGAALLAAGNAAEALVRFQAASRIDPRNATLSLYCGAALHSLGRYEDAVDAYRHGLMIAPDMGQMHNNLGNSLMALQRFPEAVESFSKACYLLPSSPVPLTARATALLALGKVVEGETDCRNALQLDSSFAAAHWNLALHLLLQGRYREGWQEYEWRWLKPDFTSPRRHTDIPLWDGTDLGGRTILLHAEQGFGDAIQFIRYSRLVAQCGGKVIVECHPELVQIMQTCAGVQRVVPFGDDLPDFDVQIPFMSLPRVLGTTLQTIPYDCPYLFVPTDHRIMWANLPNANRAALKVGIAWAGKSYPDPLRSCRLADLIPLVAIESAQFYSLQLNVGADQAHLSEPVLPMIDMTGQISNFADTAAIIEQLDLVISIDTAVAHLAAALGKTVILMLPFAPDWRWLLEGSSSPWYPTMQIFRQNHPGDWSDVISRIQSTLEILTANKKSFEKNSKD
jgi:tetratricopeptide (TPR) repeat protein